MSTFITSSLSDTKLEAAVNTVEAAVNTVEAVSSPIIYVSVDLKFLDYGQDHIKSTRKLLDPFTNELFDLLEVYDGHGLNNCIDILRQINTTEIIRTNLEPELNIQQMIQCCEPKMPYDSGSTFSCAKIYSNRVECRSVGDSEIWVYKNGERVYNSPPHNWSNLEEQERIRSFAKPLHDFIPTLLSPTKIRMDRSHKIHWKKCSVQRLVFVPSQALGHRNITGLAAAVHTVLFEPSDTIVVIVASDGFWDMIIPEDKDILCSATCAIELGNLAEMRWRQEWDFVENHDNPDETIKNTFDDFDDIAVGIYSKK